MLYSNLKYIKITLHELCVFLVIAGAFGLRVFLAREYWPLPNSDEATIGVMAIHIQHGERPIFFYGQNYMGSLEAYIAAMLFYPFGITIFALRLGLIIIYILFLASMYLLTRTLYGKNVALFTVLILSIGSNAILSRQLSAIGGYTETLLFSAQAFVFAAWLALSPPGGPLKRRLWRLVGFGAWGLVVGLGVWSDLLIVPFAMCSFCVLLLFCRRELARGAIIPLVICLLIGALPLISYNVGPKDPGQDSWSVLESQQGQPPQSFDDLKFRVKQTVTFSLPVITGSPFCHRAEYTGLLLLGFEANSPDTRQCLTIDKGWSISYLSLFFISICITAFALSKRMYAARSRIGIIGEKSSITRNTIQLTLLASAALTLVLFIRSQAMFQFPSVYSRYMMGLWVATPALLWPLWMGARATRSMLSLSRQVLSLVRVSICQGLLFLIVVIFLFGTLKTVREVPAARTAERQEQGLINTLLKVHITHIYSDYWACDRIEFQSLERITCGSLSHELSRSSFNRYEPYYSTVSHDSNSSYMFPLGLGFEPQIEKRLKQQGRRYRTFTVDGYIVYQPI